MPTPNPSLPIHRKATAASGAARICTKHVQVRTKCELWGKSEGSNGADNNAKQPILVEESAIFCAVPSEGEAGGDLTATADAHAASPARGHFASTMAANGRGRMRIGRCKWLIYRLFVRSILKVTPDALNLCMRMSQEAFVARLRMGTRTLLIYSANIGSKFVIKNFPRSLPTS